MNLESILDSSTFSTLSGAAGGVLIAVVASRIKRFLSHSDKVPTLSAQLAENQKTIDEIKHTVRDIHKMYSEIAVMQRDIKTLFYRNDEIRKAHFDFQKQVLSGGQ